MKKDKNGARPHFQTERWTRQLQNVQKWAIKMGPGPIFTEQAQEKG